MTTLRALVAAALLAALPAWAQTPYAVKTYTLASSFDLDGEPSDPDQIVTVVALTDSATYTIAAQPDTCRLIDIEVTDVDLSITGGILTVIGTDCWGYPLAGTFTFAAGGSGLKTLTPASVSFAAPHKASGAYFSSITSVTTDELTGEDGADAVTVGYSDNSLKGWPMYGVESRTPSGRRFMDFSRSISGSAIVKNGASNVDITAVSASTTEPFQNLAYGDLIIFNVSGDVKVRKVLTVTDADNIIVDQGIDLPTAGLNFSYKKFVFSTDPIDGWIHVQGHKSVAFAIEVDANANTGGVVTSVECASARSSDLPDDEIVVELDTDTIAPSLTGVAVTSINLDELPMYTHCRAGIKFGTGDDGDTADEDIDMSVALLK